MNPVGVGKHLVGAGEPVFVIGEIGINHNGDMDIAMQLIEVAANAGANAVKLQKRDPDVSVPANQRDVVRDTPWGEMTYLEYRHRMEFSFEEYKALQAFANQKGLEFFASPWDVPSAEFLLQLGVPAMKIASACLTDKGLLTVLNQMKLPVFLSTGMSTIQEIDQAVNLLQDVPLLLAHATSTYPCPPEELNLKMIRSLSERYSLPVGYSGHEVGIPTTVAAVALGAVFVERHITLSRAMWGSDQSASVEPHGLDKLVRDIRTLELALGDGVKRVFESELIPMQRLRRYM